jgi:hypothetical protein
MTCVGRRLQTRRRHTNHQMVRNHRKTSLQRRTDGRTDDGEMRRTMGMGIGMGQEPLPSQLRESSGQLVPQMSFQGAA